MECNMLCPESKTQDRRHLQLFLIETDEDSGCAPRGLFCRYCLLRLVLLARLRRLYLERLLHARPTHQLLMPLKALGVGLFPLFRVVLAEQHWYHVVPRHKHEIAVLRLGAGQVGLVGLGEMQVDHTENALDLSSVALDGRGDALLGVELQALCEHP